jgi:hypothetical protein
VLVAFSGTQTSRYKLGSLVSLAHGIGGDVSPVLGLCFGLCEFRAKLNADRSFGGSIVTTGRERLVVSLG